MDLNIPRIKIDLHEDVCEEDDKDALPKARTRAASSPEMIHCDVDSRQKKGGKITKAESFDTALILRYTEEEKSKLSGRVEGSYGVQPIPKKEKTTGNDNPRRVQTPELTKRKSLPNMLVAGKRQGNVDAIVSPLMLRRFNKTRGSKNPSFQKGGENTVDATTKTGADIPRLPKIKRSWTISDDNNENLNNRSRPFPTPNSPSLSRKDKLDVYNLKRLRNNEEEFNVKGRPRSSSLTLLVKRNDDIEESVETNRQPSMHWRLAKVHMENNNMKLPDVVQLYSDHANGRHGVGNRKMLNFHPESSNINGKTNYSRNILNKDTPDEKMQRNLKQGISLEKRLEAIEIKHGLIHDDTQPYQR